MRRTHRGLSAVAFRCLTPDSCICGHPFGEHLLCCNHSPCTESEIQHLHELPMEGCVDRTRGCGGIPPAQQCKCLGDCSRLMNGLQLPSTLSNRGSEPPSRGSGGNAFAPLASRGRHAVRHISRTVRVGGRRGPSGPPCAIWIGSGDRILGAGVLGVGFSMELIKSHTESSEFNTKPIQLFPPKPPHPNLIYACVGTIISPFHAPPSERTMKKRDQQQRTSSAGRSGCVMTPHTAVRWSDVLLHLSTRDACDLPHGCVLE